MSNTKYIISMCWMDSHHEMTCDAFGLFDTHDEANDFACEKMEEITDEYIENYDEDYVEEYLVIDFVIKEITISTKRKNSKKK